MQLNTGQTLINSKTPKTFRVAYVVLYLQMKTNPIKLQEKYRATQEW